MRYSCGIIFYRDGQILVGHTTRTAALGFT